MDQTCGALCPGCFSDKGRANPCPHCGYDEQAQRGPLILPHRTRLHEEFMIGRVLGKPGGFGITYLGWDLNLQTRVAIKEFLPRDLAGRSSDQATVAVHSQDDGELFRFGLAQFLLEARTLAQLDPSAAVQPLGEIARALGVSFYTTLVALVDSAILVLLLQLVQAREELAVNAAGRYVLVNLINRLYSGQ